MLDYDILHELILHDPITGKLYWKERHESWFDSEKLCSAWNTKYAFKPAFNTDNGQGYLRGQLLGKFYKAHRVIWKMEYGYDPDIVDHINGNRQDNAIINLRDVSIHENNKNLSLSKFNTSGYIGVSYNIKSNKWQARISHKNKDINLGSFVEKTDAILARQMAEKEYGYHENHGKR